jgi:hypothetical protein
MVQSHDELIM